MAGKKGGLGRGLDSLFGDSAVLQTPTPVERPAETKAEPKKAAPKKEAASAAEAAESVVYIKLNDIKPNASQPRKTFNEEALADLADSIKEHGVI